MKLRCMLLEERILTLGCWVMVDPSMCRLSYFLLKLIFTTRGKYYRGVCDIAKFAFTAKKSLNLMFSAINHEILNKPRNIKVSAKNHD